MKRLVTLTLLASLLSLGSGQDLKAQDLVITNARIIDGNGGTIEQGSVVVRNGRIASVSAGDTRAPGLMEIDAQGMTLMPGFIDAHRHIMRGDADQWLNEQAEDRMQDFLDAGFTTVLSAGDSLEGIIELRRRLSEGELVGPRLLTSGRASTTGSEEEARAAVRIASEAGADVVKSRIELVLEGERAKDNLIAITDEARKVGIPVMVHAATPADLIASVEARVDRLVHVPHGGWLDDTDGARMVAEAGIPMTSTIGFGVPVFGVYADDNVPRFRNGGPWPESIPRGGMIRPAGEKAVNARYLWEAGVTIGFGTDTGFHPKDSLAHELRPLNLVFSAQDIIAMLGKNAAIFLELEDEIGTLEAGKQADMVILDGDPLEDIYDVLHVGMVIQGGRVVVDNR